MEEHCSDIRNHSGAPRVGSGAAASWNDEDRTFYKLPAKLGETRLPLLVALFFGRANLGAAVSGGTHRGVTGWFNLHRMHNECSQIVSTAHSPRPAGRRGIEQEAICGT